MRRNDEVMMTRDDETRVSIQNGSAVFRNFRERLWDNRHVSIRVKCKVYRATVLATLLYAAETWTFYREQVKKLNAYMMRHL